MDFGVLVYFSLVSSFSALTLLVGLFDPYKPVPDMTYDMFFGTLNLAQSQSYSDIPEIITGMER